MGGSVGGQKVKGRKAGQLLIDCEIPFDMLKKMLAGAKVAEVVVC